MLDFLLPAIGTLLLLIARLVDGWRHDKNWPTALDLAIILGSGWTGLVLFCRALLLASDVWQHPPWTSFDSFLYLHQGDQRCWFFGCISLSLIAVYSVLLRMPSTADIIKSPAERKLDTANQQFAASEKQLKDTDAVLAQLNAEHSGIKERAVRYRNERNAASKRLLEIEAECRHLRDTIQHFEGTVHQLLQNLPSMLDILESNGHCDPTPTRQLLADLRSPPKRLTLDNGMCETSTEESVDS